MSDAGPDMVALHDQAREEVKQKGRVVGAYFAALRAGGVPEYEATRLTLMFQRRWIFPDAEPEVLDADAD